LSHFWPGWRRWLRILKLDTVLRWHRRAFARYWTRKSRRRPGRPSLAAAIRDLIEQMGQVNFLWGAPRIHGELLKLGIQVAPSTVGKYLRRRRNPPSQTWRTFLTNHMKQMASMDFFTVPTATFRVLFVFIVLSHDRRRVMHFNVTDYPSEEWTAQQMREAFPWEAQSICSEIGMRFSEEHSLRSPRTWGSKKWSRRRDRLGRIHMWND
jgi:putative transposase